MDNFWNGIYGQETVKEFLSGLINSSKIPNAFLFAGLDGVGKEFIALRFTQALNSRHNIDNNAFLINNYISNFSEPYIKFIFPLPRGKNETEGNSPTEKLSQDEIELIQSELKQKTNNPYYSISIPKATTIKVNSVRDIKKFLSLDYSEIAYRTILISDAHLMNDESQNALLKALEEPPEGVVFILTTPYPSFLRETIRSRCWNINFQPLGYADIENILINYFNIEQRLAQKISPFAGGSITNAIRLIEHDFELLLEKTISILRYSFGKKFNSALDQFSEFISENNSDSIKLLIQMIIIWLNDFQKFRFGIKDLYFRDRIDTIEKFDQRYPNLELNNIVNKLEILSSVFQNNVNINLVVLNIIFELSALVSSYN
jgi:DNA polymerase-3 subunit delta'